MPKKTEKDIINEAELIIESDGHLSSYDYNEKYKSMLENDHLRVIYDKNTLECLVFDITDVTCPDEEVENNDLTNTISLVLNENEGSFIMKKYDTQFVYPQDNMADPENCRIYSKNYFKLELDNDKPVSGDIITIKVFLYDWTGKDISEEYPCTVKIKDREGHSTLEKKILDFPKERTFRLKRIAPGAAHIRVKDSNFKCVPAVEIIDFLSPPVNFD